MPYPSSSPSSAHRPRQAETDRPDGSSPEPDPQPQPGTGLGLSATQIVGGALAAMTAAYLGSRLSVAGTVVGAAVASIVAAVAGSLYTTSLRRTRDKVFSVWTGQTGIVPTTVEAVPTWEATDGSPTEVSGVPTALTGARAAVGGVPAAVSPRSPSRLVEAAPEPPPQRSRLRRLGLQVVLGAVAIFGITALTLTGLELVSGQALSGGQGTTISMVQQPAPAPAPAPESSPSEKTRKQSAEPSSEPSATPEAPASSQPSQAPSVEPVTPSAAPSTSTPPSSPAGASAKPSTATQGDPTTDQPTAGGESGTTP